MSVGAVPQPDPTLTFDNVGLPPTPVVPGAVVSPRDALIMGDEAPVLGPPAPVVVPPTPMEAAAPPNTGQPSANSPPAAIPVTGSEADIAKAATAQQDAALAEGKAQREGAQAVADEQKAAADQAAAQAEALRVAGERQARAEDEAHRQTEDALVKARDTRIPDFWAGREGRRAETALWVGLGGIAQGLLGTNTNAAAEIVQHNVDAYYRRKKDEIDNLYKFADKKGEQEGRLHAQHAQELAMLQAQYGAQQVAIAQRIESIKTAAAGRIDGAKADEMAAKFATEGNKNILEARKTAADIAHIKAETARAREAAGASGKQLAAEAELSKMIENDVPPSEVRARAAQLGVKGSRVDALETQGRADAKARKAGGADDKLIVRDEKGQAQGMAPTSRAVPQLEKELRTLPRAIEQLKRLRAAKFVSTRAPEFHGAVLAVAATTSAGSTDANVAHEKGTLTNAFGLPDNDAIDAKIAELEEQYANAKNQLNPLPDGYTDKKTPAAGAAPASDMVTITNKKTGETKRVTREEAKKLGAL